MLRLGGLLTELPHFKVILYTYMKFAGPFITMMCSLYTVYYIFAQVGMLLFGGLITTESAQTDDVGLYALYYLINFNDFGASCVTLFAQMVMNNWYNTCNMCCEVVGSNWPRVYFILFWVASVLIMLNLVVSFVLEVYSGQSEKLKK